MSEAKAKRRTITAVRKWKIVDEAAKANGYTDAADSTMLVSALLGKLKDAALEEVAAQ